MELFRWRARNLLLVVVAVVLIERGTAKAGEQLDGSREAVSGASVGSLPAEQPASDVASRTGHGRPRREHKQKPQHDHKQAQRGRHHRPQAKQQDAEPMPIPSPLAQPHALDRTDDGEAHDLLDCQPQPGDLLLARSVVKAEFRPLAFAEATWFFPQNGQDQRTIHCVRALDQRRDGYGGYPRLVRGGVGHHYAELNFKSDFSRGFHFVVEVYGQ